ncbi:MAG TPA: hypothetical protein VGR20_13660, partial [Acidimicrobiia bacterium]|nr:hypothetical protein [Acidimicrobiia bacterium]
MRGYRRWRAWPAQDRPGLALRGLRVLLQVVILVYAAAIVGFIWMIKDLTISMLGEDRLFAGYSIAVGLYVLGRFVGALF